MKTKDVRPVLRAGSLAYFDSHLNGPMPCKVLAILGESGAPSMQTVRIKLTAARPGSGYARGDVLHEHAMRVIPRGALFKRRYGARIGYYTVEAAP